MSKLHQYELTFRIIGYGHNADQAYEDVAYEMPEWARLIEVNRIGEGYDKYLCPVHDCTECE